MASIAVARKAVFALRREIARIEGALPEELAPAGATVLRRKGIVSGDDAVLATGPILSTGIERLDRALGGGLPKAALTEIHGTETRNAGTVAGFALALAALLMKREGKGGLPLLWVGTSEIFHEAGLPYAVGLAHEFGIEAKSLLFSSTPKLADALWVAEEAARLSALAAVLVELRGNPERLDLTATRRLHRRAQLAGRPVLLIRESAFAEPTAAPVRLVVSPAPAAPRATLAGPLAGSVGAPAFSVAIGKSRTALGAEFVLEWNSHELAFQERRPQDPRRLVSLPRSRADLAPASGSVVAFARGGDGAAAGDEPSRQQHAADRRPRRAG
jgi:protein ImuA